jgi:ankyrin repeat protein
MEIEDLLDLIELIMTQKDEVGNFVEAIIKKNFVIDGEDLLIFTKMRQIGLVRFVLEHGVKPTLESYRYAAEHEFYELCRLFIEFGSRKILSTPELEKELELKYRNRQRDQFKNLINNGIDFNHDDFIFLSALFVGDIETIQLLLGHGANPKTDDNRAIRLASVRGYTNIVQLLLEYGADPTADDNRAIKIASERGNLEVVRLLLNNNSEYRVDPAAENNYAIKNASGPNKYEIIELLKSRGASL